MSSPIVSPVSLGRQFVMRLYNGLMTLDANLWLVPALYCLAFFGLTAGLYATEMAYPDVLHAPIQLFQAEAADAKSIVAAGYNPVRNLTGHGLGRWKVHTPPQIPNQAEKGGSRLETGMVFAIEPFACDGRGYITERGRAEVFMMVRPPLRAKGLDREILRDIESWRGLPIARRYFTHRDSRSVEETLQALGYSEPGLAGLCQRQIGDAR